jgi:hypothetical protein
MANMSYCRFENTLSDLRDCEEHLFDEDLSQDEDRARRRLVELCREIAEQADDPDYEEMFNPTGP